MTTFAGGRRPMRDKIHSMNLTTNCKILTTTLSYREVVVNVVVVGVVVVFFLGICAYVENCSLTRRGQASATPQAWQLAVTVLR
jgi:hypothetical protein